jgi:tetratricopeptide (TPR) repeat protein
MLYGHGYAACLVLIGILQLVALRERRDNWRMLASSGACFGLSIAFEYPTALLGLCAGLYLLSFERRVLRVLVFAALGVGLPALIIGGFNWAAFGNPLHIGYTAVKSTYYDAQMSHGLFGIALPRLDNLYLLLISPARGLFFWSPFLLFGLIGMVVMIARQRREGLLLFGMFLLPVLAFAGHFEAGGGAGLGPRHLVPLVGPLILAGAWLVGRARPWLRSLYFSAAIFSSLLVSVGLFAEPQMPDRVVNPLWEFAAPMLLGGIGPGNLFGLPDPLVWPLALLLLVGLWLTIRLAPEDKPSRTEYSAGLVGFVLLAAFYLGLGPHLGHTDPGILHQVRGNHFMVREDYSQAALEYERAYATRKDPWILFYLARAYSLAGDKLRAGSALRRLMQTDPAFLPALRQNRAAQRGP